MSSMLPSFWRETDNPLMSMQKEMDRLLQDFGRKWPAASSFEGGFPAIDIHETETGLELTAELPGVAEKDVEVALSGTTLTIKGEKSAGKTVSEKDRHVSERSYGSFRRVMTLPFEPELDQVAAEMDNGVLTLVLPKPASATEVAKKIEVTRKG